MRKRKGIVILGQIISMREGEEAGALGSCSVAVDSL